MKVLIKTDLSLEKIVEKLKNSDEFVSSSSNQYNKRLMYENAINMHFIEQTSDAEFLITENAGYGGLDELFAFVKIQEYHHLEVKFKRGGMNYKWMFMLVLGISIASLTLLIYSPYFLGLSILLFFIAGLIDSANKKSVKIIKEKIEKTLIIVTDKTI